VLLLALLEIKILIFLQIAIFFMMRLSNAMFFLPSPLQGEAYDSKKPIRESPSSRHSDCTYYVSSKGSIRVLLSRSAVEDA
jgi:hypothetical protein